MEKKQEQEQEQEEKQEQKELIPPVQEGDIIENVEIINTGKKGDGVIKYEGYIIFVENCTLGEKVNVKITKIFKNMGLGEKVE